MRGTHSYACRAGRFLCFFLAILLVGGIMGLWTPLPVAAVAEDAPSDGRIGASYLLNLENNLVLQEKAADTPIYPSSSVKIMTGLLSCRALEGRLDEAVTVTAAMVAGVSGRQMHLADGEVLTVRDLLYAAICGSYNDAAQVLACLVSGSVAEFVGEMNREAERVGAVATHYTNPTGLHDPAMSTTVRDVSLVAREAYACELYMTISSERVYTISATNASEARTFTNRNSLISDSSRNYYNGYCRGMNAGMTDEGGWCVVTVAERDGAATLCIVMQGADAAEGELVPAYVYANRLISWAHRNYGYRTVLAAGESPVTLPVGMTGISKSKAALAVVGDLGAYLPADADPTAEVVLHTTITGGELTAPLQAGQVVGYVTATYDDRVVGRAELIVTEDFDKSLLLGGMMAFRDYLCSRAFWITLFVFVILLLLFLRLTGGPGGRYGIRSTKRRGIRYVKRHF